MLGSLAADTPHLTVAAPAPAVTVSAGGCSASPLPLDATCAAVARRLFRAAAGGVGLPAESIYDGATMASELAANSMHAQTGVQFDVRGCAVAGAPEIWLYLRRVGGTQELVCMVFDALPRWKDDAPPDPAVPVPVDAVSGRGLHVVEGLSHGRWGHHLTRARLGSWKVSGKAVWFAVPVPASSALDRFRGPAAWFGAGRGHPGADALRAWHRPHRPGGRPGLEHVGAVHPARPDRVVPQPGGVLDGPQRSP